ncbi:MAG: hypothetical protein EA428_08925 [Spirochaetaceae bacterium]|nr:MAG: hypothetical protein EA428_08925 [Spirochaetaceae bacterium]
MKRTHLRLIASILLMFSTTMTTPFRSAAGLFAQQAGFEDDEVAAEPYRPDEFPKPLLGVRRFTIIATGAFPVTMFFGGLFYEFARFGYYSAQSGEVRGDYAPLFFGPTTGPRFNEDEQRNVLMVGVSLSLFVALLDFTLGRIETRRADNQSSAQ